MDQKQQVLCGGCGVTLVYTLQGCERVIPVRDSSEHERVYVQCAACKFLTFLFEQYIHNPVVKESGRLLTPETSKH